MAKLITKFKYIKPGNGAGSYLKYIATREGVEKIDDSKSCCRPRQSRRS